MAICKVNGDAEGKNSPNPPASVALHIGNPTNHKYVHSFDAFEIAAEFEFEGDPGHGNTEMKHGLTAGLAVDQLVKRCRLDKAAFHRARNRKSGKMGGPITWGLLAGPGDRGGKGTVLAEAVIRGTGGPKGIVHC